MRNRGEKALAGKTILFVSPCRINHLRQRHQAFAEGFAKAGATVWFLNPLQGGGLSLRHRSVAASGITSIDVRVPFRATGQPSLHRISCRLARHLLRQHGFWSPGKTLLWVAEPAVASWTEFPWSALFYDRCDRHGFFPGQKRDVWQSYDHRLYQHSRLIFCSSPVIQQDVPSSFQEKVILVPNAGTILGSASGQEPGGISRRVPVAYLHRPSPPWRAISAGAHFEWTDWTWLHLLLEAPGLQLELAGPGRGPEFRKLLVHPRVRYHGVLDHDSLQHLLGQCHIGLVPFVDSPLAHGVDPIKAYEYASAGLHVWAPLLPHLASHPLVNRCISHAGDLQQAMNTLPTSPTHPLIPTWEDRLDQILGHLTAWSSGSNR